MELSFGSFDAQISALVGLIKEFLISDSVVLWNSV